MRAPGEPTAYAVRVSEQARRQIDLELVRIYDDAGEAAAIAWSDGMDEAIAGLATLPERCAAAPEGAAPHGAFCSASAQPTRTTRRRCGCIRSATAHRTR